MRSIHPHKWHTAFSNPSEEMSQLFEPGLWVGCPFSGNRLNCLFSYLGPMWFPSGFFHAWENVIDDNRTTRVNVDTYFPSHQQNMWTDRLESTAWTWPCGALQHRSPPPARAPAVETRHGQAELLYSYCCEYSSTHLAGYGGAHVIPIDTTVPGPRSGGPGILGPIQSCHVSLWPTQAKLQGYDYSLHVACNAARDKAASLGVDRAKLNKQVRCPAASPATLPPAPHGIPCSRLFTFAI